MLKRTCAGIGLVLALLAAAGCGGAEDAGEGKPEGGSASAPDRDAQGQGPESDLADVPRVVARVNGQPIQRAEFVDAYTSSLQQSAAQPGAQVDKEQLKKQTVDNLVATELLMQEADRQKIEATDRDVDRAMTDLAEQNGMKSPDQLVTALKQQGLTEREVRDQVRAQVAIDRVISAEAGDTTPTRAEVEQLYDQLVAQQEQAGGAGQEVPPLNQVRPQLEQQVASQKEAAAAQKLVTRLRGEADVTINL